MSFTPSFFDIFLMGLKSYITAEIALFGNYAFFNDNSRMGTHRMK